MDGNNLNKPELPYLSCTIYPKLCSKPLKQRNTWQFHRQCIISPYSNVASMFHINWWNSVPVYVPHVISISAVDRQIATLQVLHLYDSRKWKMGVQEESMSFHNCEVMLFYFCQVLRGETIVTAILSVFISSFCFSLTEFKNIFLPLIIRYLIMLFKSKQFILKTITTPKICNKNNVVKTLN